MVKAITIPSAKSLLVNAALRSGYYQKIDRGSFEGDQYRLQLPVAMAEITSPLFDMVPVPPTRDWPAEQTLEACEKYYAEYIVGQTIGANEEYTYADRIARGEQLSHVVDMLSETPGTNQATLTVGSPEDASIENPACLREIHFKFFNDKLNMFTIWRSHDLYAGFGMNMVGLALLFRDVCEYAGHEPGSIFYYSTGSHVYQMAVEMLKGGR